MSNLVIKNKVFLQNLRVPFVRLAKRITRLFGRRISICAHLDNLSRFFLRFYCQEWLIIEHSKINILLRNFNFKFISIYLQ
jgi:hypothetical protein